MKKLFYLVAIISLFLVSCEGPMGPSGLNGLDGADGADGKDASMTCLTCHSDANLQAIRAQFASSGHTSNEVAEEHGEWSASCTQCHSSEGFITYANTGLAPTVGTSSPAGQFECRTCHSIHKTFEAADYAFRLTAPLKFITDATKTVDFKNANLCASCHQSRRSNLTLPAPDADGNITVGSSTRADAHGGPQANIFYGFGLAELTGTESYSAVGTSQHFSLTNKCTTCHMGSYASGKGGHTFKAIPVAVGTVANTNCATCHTDGVKTTIKNKVTADLNTLRDLLLARGLITYDALTATYVKVNGKFHKNLVYAMYNWNVINADASFGAHNPSYIQAVLTNSIAAVNAIPAK